MTSPTGAEPSAAAGAGPTRVPAVTPVFWIVKVLTTGMGETISDFLVQRFPPEAVVPLALIALVAMLLLQFRMRRYVAGVYWGCALMVSVFGTMAADVLHVGLGVPYAISTTTFALLLVLVLAVWLRVEGTLSVHTITTARRERFYWATVLTTFALGTAAGDLTASALGLGYLGSGVLFAALIAVPAVLHAVTRRGPVLAFWTAYVITRPLGASFADWIAVPQARGGLGAGAGPVSVVALALFVAIVCALQFTKVDVPQSSRVTSAA